MPNPAWVRLARRAVPLLAVLVPAACVFSSVRIEPVPTTAARTQVEIRTPVKAHLADGSVVVFRTGVVVRQDTLVGRGMRYDLTLRDSAVTERLPLDQVAAMESFTTDVDGAATAVGSLLGTAAVVGGTVVLAKALFGSCPTIYADTGGALALQAEAFSYSIAPRFEMRDADRIVVRPDAAGQLVVEVRNEALETHYINQLAMLEVRHAPDELVVPDPRGRPLVLGGMRDLASARDRLGRDVTAALARPDGEAYRSQERVLAEAETGELEDHVDLVVPRPASDSAAVVFRLRNSLLNTVLLYDVLLAGRGVQALDWLGANLQDASAAFQLGEWYVRRMGMRVAVRDGGAWRTVARGGDAGPIAWKDVAVVVPVPRGEDSLRVRLSFVADNWRIDQVRVAAGIRPAEVRALAPAAVAGPDDRDAPAALAAVQDADGRYLTTRPGDRFTVRWAAGAAPPATRTFLLESRGYYTEWIRQAWLRQPPETPPGPPTDALLRRALSLWRAQQPDFERRFEATRIPVR